MSARGGQGFDRGLAFKLFERALGLKSDERAKFIGQMCGEDRPLRVEVEALLEAAGGDAQTGLLLTPCAGPAESLVGTTVGHFRLVELIGEGGMGVVYRAERTDTIQQTVAVKLIANPLAKAGLDRFRRETQMLATLEHPSIARMIDADVDGGRAWIALEFVPGRPIDEYCEERRLPLRARVQLLAELAGAVAAAHRMLIVHRDIKPANVLVTRDGAPKLIDFGIAAALLDHGASHTQTVDVGRLFTPHYAAPEQVSGEPITVATDVFGLGALGYRLLTGQTLFPEVRSAVDYLLAITQRDVDTPSRVVQHGPDPGAARPLRGDLDAILRKALQRDPVNRYASAADMQADLQRYLDDKPVVARPPSAAIRIGKFARRNSVATSLAAFLAISAIAGVVGYAAQARRAAEAREMTARRGEFLESLLKSADPRRGGSRDMTVAQLLDASGKKIDLLAADEPLVAASMLNLVAETYLNLGLYAKGLEFSARAIELLRSYDGGAVDLSGALSIRGELLLNGGHNPEATTQFREALALVEHRRGAARQLTEALEGLAKASQNMGREEEAEAFYKREYEVYRTSAGNFGGRAGFPLSGLATIRFDQGRYADALAYMERALAIERKEFPPDHPDLLDAEYNYAALLEQSGKTSEAEPVFRKLLASYRRFLGPEHSDTYAAQEGLAHDLLSQKRYSEAADEALPAAQGLSRTLGDDDSWTLTAWGVYGTSACLAGNGDAGLAALRHVAATRGNSALADDWRAASTGVQLGSCLIALGRYAEAEPILLASVPILEKSRGPTSDRTQAGFAALRDLYAKIGRPTESALWQQKLSSGRQ